MAISAKDISNARERMGDSIIRTPTIYSPGLSKMTGVDIHLKLENQQVTSSFKPRGAFTRIEAMDKESARKGVIAMSAGNHAQAVAYHAIRRNMPSVIVMPAQTPFSKVNRTRAWGAEVILEGRDLNDCEATVNAIMAERGMTLIHPYDDPLVIIGQGSVGLEMLQDISDLDAIIVPIGGGGLIAGIAVIAREMNPNISLVGVEAALWPSMTQAINSNSMVCGGETLAEGIAVKSPGVLTKPIIEKLVNEILLVDEDHIERAISALVEQQRLVAEGAGAAGIAAILQYPNTFKGKRCGVVVCGGNIDSRLLAGVLTRSMAKDGRIARLRVDISDEPGMLASISTAIGDCKGNIVEIFHQRMFHDVPAKLAKIDVVVETHGEEHINEIIAAIKKRNFKVAVLSDTQESTDIKKD